MRRLGKPTSLLLLVGLAASPACDRSKKAEVEANAKKVTADSTVDATEPIVDEDYRFRLESPSKGWKLMREEDARKLNSGAVAGAFDGSTVYGIVTVERFPGSTLEQAVELAWAPNAPDFKVESIADITFNDKPAKRRTVTQSVNGERMRFTATAFVHQDHLFQLVSWGLEGKATAPSLLPFHESFKLLDGEIKGREDSTPPVTAAQGVGWRIKDGVFESVSSGLRAQPPEGWAYQVDRDLEMLNADAEMAWLNKRDNSFVILIPERVPAEMGVKMAGFVRDNLEANLGQPIGSHNETLGGKEVEFRQYRQGPLEYFHGVRVEGEAVTQMMYWYPASFSEGAKQRLKKLTAALKALSVAERDALRSELIAAPTNEHRFSRDRAFRGGMFMDFENRVMWERPPGLWTVLALDETKKMSPDAVLGFQEVEHTVHGMLEVLSAAQFNPQTTVQTMANQHNNAKFWTTTSDGLTVFAASADGIQSGMKTNFLYAFASRGSKTYGLSIWAIGDSPAKQKAMKAAMEGLSFPKTLAAKELVDGVHKNVQFGVSLRPPAGFVHKDMTPSGFGGGHVDQWAKGNQEVVSLVGTGVEGHNVDEWMTSFIEQGLRDEAAGNLGAPTRTEGTLSGHKCRHLEWSSLTTKMQADLFVRDGVIYGLILANTPKAVGDNVRESYKVLD